MAEDNYADCSGDGIWSDFAEWVLTSIPLFIVERPYIFQAKKTAGTSLLKAILRETTPIFSTNEQMKKSRKHARTHRQQVIATSSAGEMAAGDGLRKPTVAILGTQAQLTDEQSALHKIVQSAMFWSPTFPGERWKEHIPLAFWLMQVIRPKVAVELGTVLPESYFALCQANSRLGFNARCIALDTRKTSDPKEGSADIARIRAYEELHYGAFSASAQHTFRDALDLFERGSIDLLHLNLTLSAEDSVDETWAEWLPKISDAGVLLISGVGIQAQKPKVRAFLLNLCSHKRSFEFLIGSGALVVGIGSKISEPLRHLLELGDHGSEATCIREVFSRLALGNKMQSFDRQSTRENQEHSELREEAARARIVALEVEHRGSLERIKREGEELERELREQIDIVERELLEARRRLNQRAAEMTHLSNEIGRLESICDRQTRELSELTKLFFSEEEKVERLRSEIAAAASIPRVGEEGRANGQRRGIWRVIAPGKRTIKANDGAKWLEAQKLLLSSALFDEKWYLQTYPNVAEHNMPAVEHYLRIGAALGYNPSAHFDSQFYLTKYTDVRASGMNPLVHYLRFGINENRKPKAN